MEKKESALTRAFIEAQKRVIIGRINKYQDRERISYELQNGGDISDYIAYKQEQVVPQLEKALRLIESGQYGICLCCGLEIETKRLQLVPAAMVCMKCLNKSS